MAAGEAERNLHFDQRHPVRHQAAPAAKAGRVQSCPREHMRGRRLLVRHAGEIEAPRARRQLFDAAGQIDLAMVRFA